jgi:hypothetical protein
MSQFSISTINFIRTVTPSLLWLYSIFLLLCFIIASCTQRPFEDHQTAWMYHYLCDVFWMLPFFAPLLFLVAKSRKVELVLFWLMIWHYLNPILVMFLASHNHLRMN